MHREFVGTYRELVGSLMGLVGKRREFVGTYRELVGNLRGLAGVHRTTQSNYHYHATITHLLFENSLLFTTIRSFYGIDNSFESYISYGNCLEYKTYS